METFNDEGAYENEEGGAHHKNATKQKRKKNRFAERNSNIESGTHKHPPADGAVHCASVGPLAGGLVGGARDIVL